MHFLSTTYILCYNIYRNICSRAELFCRNARLESRVAEKIFASFSSLAKGLSRIAPRQSRLVAQLSESDWTRTSSLEGMLLACREQLRESAPLLQIEVFIEAATTRGDIRGTAPTKLALCSSRTRGCFHRRDQVSFQEIPPPSIFFSNDYARSKMQSLQKCILIVTCDFFSADISRHRRQCTVAATRISRLMILSLFFSFRQ